MRESQKKAIYNWNRKNPKAAAKVRLRSQCKRYILKFANNADLLQIKKWVDQASKKLKSSKEK